MDDIEKKIRDSMKEPRSFTAFLDSLEPKQARGSYEVPPHVAENPFRNIRLVRN